MIGLWGINRFSPDMADFIFISRHSCIKCLKDNKDDICNKNDI